MKPLRWLLLLVVLSLAIPTYAAEELEVVDNRVEVDFPTSITFYLKATGEAVIDSIELEYGAIRASCGAASSKVRPEFEPGPNVTVNWSWDLRRSGSIPPGTPFWWRWRIKDEAGNEIETARQEVAFDDLRYTWQETRSEEMVLFSAVSDPTVNQTLWQAANEALDQLEREVGSRPAGLIKIYNYPHSEALREAILYTQDWVGGLAFSDYNTLLVGISQEDLDWGPSLMVHELTHLIIHQITANCLGDLPSWLNEGLATYMEGELPEDQQTAFDEAVNKDTLHSLRSLNGSFPTHSQQTTLAYAQSSRVVAYLFDAYGSQKMAELLRAFQAGQGYDQTLQQVYGFDTQGLDNEWRLSLGLQPRQVVATATPTLIPTLSLLTASQPTATPTAEPTSPPATATPRPTATATTTPTALPPPPAPVTTSTNLSLSAGISLMLLIFGSIGGVIWYFRRN